MSNTTPAADADRVYVPTQDGRLHAVDKVSGEEQWALQIAEGLTSAPVLANGTLYLASKDGTLYAVE